MDLLKEVFEFTSQPTPPSSPGNHRDPETFRLPFNLEATPSSSEGHADLLFNPILTPSTSEGCSDYPIHGRATPPDVSLTSSGESENREKKSKANRSRRPSDEDVTDWPFLAFSQDEEDSDEYMPEQNSNPIALDGLTTSPDPRPNMQGIGLWNQRSRFLRKIYPY